MTDQMAQDKATRESGTGQSKEARITELEAQLKSLERQLLDLQKPAVDWESGMFSALSLTLMRAKDNLTFERQHLLNLMPTRIDCLIIKKDDSLPIALEAFRLFKKYNVIELKSYRDALNIKAFWRVLGYAAMFRSQNPDVSVEDIAVSIFRAAKPIQLLKDLRSEGWEIEERYHNVFYLSRYRDFSVQIVVTKDLGDEYLPLQILTGNAKEEDVRKFIEFRDTLTGEEERDFANSVLYACSEGNADLFKKLREDEKMRGVLRDILKDDLIAAEQKGVGKAFNIVTERLIRRGDGGNAIADITGYDRATIDSIAKSINCTVAW